MDYVELVDKMILTTGASAGSSTGEALDLNLKDRILPHSIPILGSLPIVSNKISESLANLSKLTTVDTPNGPVDAKQVYAAIRLFHFLNRSMFYTTTRKDPRYMSLTPMLMYAIKEIQNKPYEYWDKKDPKAVVLMGLNLYKAVNEYSMPTRKEIESDRNIQFKMHKEGDYKITKGLAFKAPMLTKLMVMQCWKAAPSERVPGAMILDLDNWDNVPEPFAPKVEDTKKVDDLWF